MVDEVVDAVGLEFVQDGDGDRAVGKRRKETHAPVGLIARADGDLVPPAQSTLLECNVQFGNSPGDIAEGERHPLVIGQGRAVPILLETLLEEFVDRFEFHLFRFLYNLFQ